MHALAEFYRYSVHAVHLIEAYIPKIVLAKCSKGDYCNFCLD